jgi:hypothetical protein
MQSDMVSVLAPLHDWKRGTLPDAKRAKDRGASTASDRLPDKQGED